MKEFVISEAQVETAILVGLVTQTQDERKTMEYLDELEFLAETAGATVVKRYTDERGKTPCAGRTNRTPLSRCRCLCRMEAACRVHEFL